MNQSHSNQRVVFTALLFFRPKRSWKPVAWALVISIILEIISWRLKITGDTNLPMAVLNGSLVWLSLSLLFFAARSFSYHVFYRWMGMSAVQSFHASQALDALILLSSGLVLVNILHLTNTTTSAFWGWYFVLGMLHCVRAGQLRRNIK
jgi:hypothetical protein